MEQVPSLVLPQTPVVSRVIQPRHLARHCIGFKSPMRAVQAGKRGYLVALHGLRERAFRAKLLKKNTPATKHLLCLGDAQVARRQATIIIVLCRSRKDHISHGERSI